MHNRLVREGETGPRSPRSPLPRRRNFGGPSYAPAIFRFDRCTTCTTLEFQRPRRRLLNSFVVFVKRPRGARPRNSGSGSEGPEEIAFPRSLDLTPGSCESIARLVNWPFSHVNQPRFAPTLRPTFAGWPPPKVRCLSSSFFFPPVDFSLASSIESDSNGIAGRPTIYASFRAWPYSENKRSLAQSVFTDDLPALAGTRPPGRSRSILSLFLFDVTVQSCVWQDISVLYIYMEILDCLSSMYCAFEGCNNRLLVSRKNSLWYLMIFNERVVEDLINDKRKEVDRMFSFVTKKRKRKLFSTL